MKRYQRNLGTFGEEGQQRLFSSHACIVGAGGLGGAVFEILVRAGVGTITIVDFDRFEETNLNRQLLSTEANLGTPKVLSAARRAQEINRTVDVRAVEERMTADNAAALIENADLVCDCLDSIDDRFVLERAVRKARIPLVHAAVAGTEGQIAVLLPEGPGLAAIYGATAPKRGTEATAGTPPDAVFVVAALSAHEAIELLAQQRSSLADRLLRIELASHRLQRLDLAGSKIRTTGGGIDSTS